MALIIAKITRCVASGISILVLLNSSVSFASTARSVDGVGQLQKQLIELRATVDAKSEELSLLRQEHKQKRKFMLSQIAEFESSVEHKELAIAKINNKLKKNKEIIDSSKGSDVLMQDLETAMSELTLYVSESLPFKRKARLEALEEMHQQLISKAVSAPRLANKLWAFVEDEIMLTKGNGVYRQIIKLNNDEKLVDVARIGMMMLYYRDGAGNVGMAKASGENNGSSSKNWNFVALNNKEEIHQIHYLFDSFQKQVRFGEFTLPNTLSGAVVGTEK